eukprot:6045591-Amphidinium_carterae.1
MVDMEPSALRKTWMTSFAGQAMCCCTMHSGFRTKSAMYPLTCHVNGVQARSNISCGSKSGSSSAPNVLAVTYHGASDCLARLGQCAQAEPTWANPATAVPPSQWISTPDMTQSVRTLQHTA